MSQENLEIVRTAMASFVRTGEFGSLLAPDAVVANAPGSPFSIRGSGPTALREWVADVDEAFEEWEFRPDQVLDSSSDKVVVLSHVWGRGRGMGVEIEMELNIVYTLGNGQITRMEGFMTREEALEAAGLSG